MTKNKKRPLNLSPNEARKNLQALADQIKGVVKQDRELSINYEKRGQPFAPHLNFQVAEWFLRAVRLLIDGKIESLDAALGLRNTLKNEEPPPRAWEVFKAVGQRKRGRPEKGKETPINQLADRYNTTSENLNREQTRYRDRLRDKQDRKNADELISDLRKRLRKNHRKPLKGREKNDHN